MRVKPGPGLKVRHPVTKDLYDDTQAFEVDPLDLFWAKLLEHSDVVPAGDEPTSDA